VLAPVEAEPAHVALDGVDIFLRLLGRVGVVVAQVAVAAEFLGNAEIEADRLGVADMEVAVRLRRKTGDDALVPARGQIRTNDVADEILPGFPYCGFGNRHALNFGTAQRRRRRARIEQIARPGQVRQRIALAPPAVRGQPHVRFRGEADVNRPAKLAGSIGSDPGRLSAKN
jgi:hypothetical protein